MHTHTHTCVSLKGSEAKKKKETSNNKIKSHNGFMYKCSHTVGPLNLLLLLHVRTRTIVKRCLTAIDFLHKIRRLLPDPPSSLALSLGVSLQVSLWHLWVKQQQKRTNCGDSMECLGAENSWAFLFKCNRKNNRQWQGKLHKPTEWHHYNDTVGLQWWIPPYHLISRCFTSVKTHLSMW